MDGRQRLHPKFCNGYNFDDLELCVRVSRLGTTSLADVVCADLLDWFPIFFEGCKDRSPTEAGIDLFGLSYSTSLIAIVAAIAVKKTGKYLTSIYIGWAMTIVGAGLLTTLGASSSLAKSVGFQIIVGGGVGITCAVTLFPILASIPVTQTAPAMALYVFSNNFGYVRHLLSVLHPSLTAHT